jgi:hypothetical protein
MLKRSNSSLFSGNGSNTLSNFWHSYKPYILGGLGGAGIGAAGLGGLAALSGEEDPEVKSQNIKRNLMLGATLGGVGGAGLGAGFKMNNEPTIGSTSGQIGSTLMDSNLVRGGALAGGAHAAVKSTLNNGSKWFPFLGKGLFGGKDLDSLRSILDERVKGLMSGLSSAPATTTPGASIPAAEQSVRETVQRMTGGTGVLGRLSQNPLARTFGFNMVDGGAEQNVINSLRNLTTTPEGTDALKRILSDQGVKGTGYPLLQKAILRGAEGDEALRRLNLFGSTVGRVGTGAGIAAGLSGLHKLFSN